jgi:hypothetical protein
VEPMGFEPTTSSMPSRRAPNCATAPPEYANILAHVGAQGGVKPPLRMTGNLSEPLHDDVKAPALEGGRYTALTEMG